HHLLNNSPITENLERGRIKMILERLHEPLRRIDLAELAFDDAVMCLEAVRAARAHDHLFDDSALAPPFGDERRIGPDGEDVRARRVEDPLDADLELARSGDRRLVHLTARPSSRAR